MNEQLINYIPITFSTNRQMADFIQDNLLNNKQIDELFTLYAGYQKSGKGLATNRWHSEANQNILATIYFKPPILASVQFLFNQCFAVAIQQFLSQFITEVMIKWPNDIYFRGKKMAGILIEHTILGDKIEHTIAGVGININQLHFPDELPNAVSLAQITGQIYSIDDLMRQLHAVCTRFYSLLKNGETKLINDLYMNNLYQFGTPSSYQIRGQVCVAKIIGIDHFGRLLLEDEAGKVYCCGLKEVVFL
jgi:BirA family biotin operon repressor/biotin-[acetyl-CoA-carboxylase] ligase